MSMPCMVMIRTIQVRLTRDQYEAIKMRSHTQGFNSLSAYLRFVALDQDLTLHKRVFEIHAHLLRPQHMPQPKKRDRAPIHAHASI